MSVILRNGRPLISQLDVFLGGPKRGSGNMMNKPIGPPANKNKDNMLIFYLLGVLYYCINYEWE